MLKMPILLQSGLRFNIILIKVSTKSFVEIGKFILKFIWKGKGHRTAKQL